MNNPDTPSKPTTPEQPAEEGLDETTCSPLPDVWIGNCPQCHTPYRTNPPADRTKPLTLKCGRYGQCGGMVTLAPLEGFPEKTDEEKWRDHFVLPIAAEMKRRGIGEMWIKLTEKGTAVFELLPENVKHMRPQ